MEEGEGGFELGVEEGELGLIALWINLHIGLESGKRESLGGAAGGGERIGGGHGERGAKP